MAPERNTSPEAEEAAKDAQQYVQEQVLWQQHFETHPEQAEPQEEE